MGIYDALLGSVGDENSYLAQDPYYGAARQIASFQTPAARNNTEAFLLPFLQSGISTALAGYGQSNALDSMYADTRTALSSIPQSSVSSLLADSGAAEDPAQQILAQYSAEERPDSWNAKTGKLDLAKAILTAQATQEAEAKKQTIREELGKTLAGNGLLLTQDGTIAQIPGYAEAVGSIEQSKRGEKKADVPAALVGELADQKGVVDEARLLGQALLDSNASYSGMKGSQLFSVLDADGTASRISDLADRVLRSRSGAAAPAQEKANLQKIISGDFSAGPQQMGNLILKFAEREASNARSKAELATSGDFVGAFAPAGTQQGGPVPTGKTSGGKPVFKLPDGRLVVED